MLKISIILFSIFFIISISIITYYVVNKNVVLNLKNFYYTDKIFNLTKIKIIELNINTSSFVNVNPNEYFLVGNYDENNSPNFPEFLISLITTQANLAQYSIKILIRGYGLHMTEEYIYPLTNFNNSNIKIKFEFDSNNLIINFNNNPPKKIKFKTIFTNNKFDKVTIGKNKNYINKFIKFNQIKIKNG